MSNPLEKVVKVTSAQYETLKNGGTVGSYTGLSANNIYLVKDTGDFSCNQLVVYDNRGYDDGTTIKICNDEDCNTGIEFKQTPGEDSEVVAYISCDTSTEEFSISSYNTSNSTTNFSLYVDPSGPDTTLNSFGTLYLYSDYGDIYIGPGQGKKVYINGIEYKSGLKLYKHRITMSDSKTFIIISNVSTAYTSSNFTRNGIIVCYYGLGGSVDTYAVPYFIGPQSGPDYYSGTYIYIGPATLHSLTFYYTSISSDTVTEL